MVDLTFIDKGKAPRDIGSNWAIIQRGTRHKWTQKLMRRLGRDHVKFCGGGVDGMLQTVGEIVRIA